MQPENKLTGEGGCRIINSTDTYEGTETNDRFYAFAVHGYPVIEELEANGVDVMAKYGFDVEPNLTEGMFITARKKFPFNKIKFSTSAPVILYLD